MPPPPVREASVVATTVSYETLQVATGAFQQRIGRGGFGDVFLGRAIWRAEEAIAVKRWRQDSRQVGPVPCKWEVRLSNYGLAGRCSHGLLAACVLRGRLCQAAMERNCRRNGTVPLTTDTLFHLGFSPQRSGLLGVSECLGVSE